MRFYHGTTEENWAAIQNDGFLFGRRYLVDNDGNKVKELTRCTYLATDKEEAASYGDVVLEVEYNPYASIHNNYMPDCWQLRVYEPIPLTNVKRIN